MPKIKSSMITGKIWKWINFIKFDITFYEENQELFYVLLRLYSLYEACNSNLEMK